VIPNALPFSLPDTAASPRAKTMLFVGRIHPEKGLDLFFRALGQLPVDALAAWKLEIVGPHETHLGGGGDRFAETVRSLAERSGVRFEWLGPIFDESELIRRYQSAAVFVYPSVAETGEALPVAPLEAMANSCVPLVSGLACFEDYVENGVTGFVFDHRAPNPVKSLAESLAVITQTTMDELAKMGEAARERMARFAVEPVANRYLADFATLLEEDHHLAQR
jgi:glycosyltransferase involved in cell wall biosynthesis